MRKYKKVILLLGMITRAQLCLIMFEIASCAEAKSIETSRIYQINPVVDGSIIGFTGIAAAFTYFSADRWIRKRCPCNSGEVNSFDRGSTGNANVTLDSISDVTLGAVIFIPPILDYLDVGFTPELKDDLFIYFETFGINGFLNTAAKYTVQRPLPRTYAGDEALVDKPGGYRSFYSGHTSTTFSLLSAAATTYNLRYHEGVWPWLVVGGVGTSVALERVAAGRHFPTDVIVGAVLGTTVGVAVPYFHQKASTKVFISAATLDDGGAVYAKVNF